MSLFSKRTCNTESNNFLFLLCGYPHLVSQGDLLYVFRFCAPSPESHWSPSLSSARPATYIRMFSPLKHYLFSLLQEGSEWSCALQCQCCYFWFDVVLETVMEVDISCSSSYGTFLKRTFPPLTCHDEFYTIIMLLLLGFYAYHRLVVHGWSYRSPFIVAYPQLPNGQLLLLALGS